MKSYRNEIIYALGFSIGFIGCAISILTLHNSIALLMLLIAAVFILLELYSLFLRIDGDGRISTSTATLKPDAYSMPDPYLYDDIESVSEPVIIHKNGDE